MKFLIFLTATILGGGIPFLICVNLLDKELLTLTNPYVYLWYVMCMCHGIGCGFIAGLLVDD